MKDSPELKSVITTSAIALIAVSINALINQIQSDTPNTGIVVMSIISIILGWFMLYGKYIISLSNFEKRLKDISVDFHVGLDVDVGNEMPEDDETLDNYIVVAEDPRDEQPE